jgi:hypothetical protein
MAASRERRGAVIDDNVEEDEVTLDASNEKGLRKIQVSAWLLFEDSTSSSAAKVVQSILVMLILVSTINMLIESHTNCRFNPTSGAPGSNEGRGTPYYQRTCDEVTWSPQQVKNFEAVESVCIAAFTVEFIARLLACPATVGLNKFVTNPMNWIDLLAIMPFYLEHIMLAIVGGGEGGADLGPFAVLRVIRLTRVVRVLKVSKSMRGPVILARTIAKSAVPFLMLVSFVLILAILCSSLMLSAEKGTYVNVHENATYRNYYRVDGSTSSFASFWFVAWWCIQTLTSEGYGDDAPITDAGKVVATLTAVSGMFLLALPITIIGANFDEEYERSQRAAALDKKSRVVQFNLATRNGTRPLKPPRSSVRSSLFRGSRVTPHGGAPAAGSELAPTPSKFDEKFQDQAFNVQADISMLLDEHFEQLRDKFNGILRRNTDNLNRWITTDLAFIDKESRNVGTTVFPAGVSGPK